MGLKKPLIDYITRSILSKHDTLHNLKILEFGNQIVRDGQGYFEKTGKEYWTNQLMDHTSVDVNGQHGALKKDLTKISDFQGMFHQFDVVYNAGTSEHVEPFEDQYTCFKIADMCCKIGGIMIHAVPEIRNRDIRGTWVDHCRYYYSEKFFETLIKESNYEYITSNKSNTSISSTFQKTTNSNFMKDKELFLSNIAIRNENKDFSQDTNYIYQAS